MSQLDLQYYQDEGLSEELPKGQLNEVISRLSKTEPGKTNSLSIYIRNPFKDKVTLSGRVQDPEVEMVVPSAIDAGMFDKMTFTFRPNPNRREKLLTKWELDVEIGLDANCSSRY